MFAFRRSMSTVASSLTQLKKSNKIVCIGRNYACVDLPPDVCRNAY